MITRNRPIFKVYQAESTSHSINTNTNKYDEYIVDYLERLNITKVIIVIMYLCFGRRNQISFAMKRTTKSLAVKPLRSV